MAVHWNPVLLNMHLAPGISDFTSACLPDLREPYPEAEHWPASHFLTRVLRGELAGKARQFGVTLVFRARTSLLLYHRARESTLRYLTESSPHRPKLRTYFELAKLAEALQDPEGV
jgi:hypothetical protein